MWPGNCPTIIKQLFRPLLLLSLLIFVLPVWAAATSVPMFVLHSYHQEYPWTQGQHRRFVQTLSADTGHSYTYTVDYTAFSSFGITLAPEQKQQSSIVNPLPGFYQANNKLIVTALVGLSALLLIGFSVFLILYARKNRQLAIVSQQQSKQSHDHLAITLKTVLNGIIVIDEKGLICDFNPAAEQIFGYLQSEVIGKNVSLLMPEPHASQHDSYLRHYQETGRENIIGSRRELNGRRKNGELFPMELAVNIAMHGEKKLFTGVVHDITRRKQDEAALMVQSHQIEIISSAQSQFISGASPANIFDALLRGILALSGSEYGFIGEVVTNTDGSRELKTHALTSIRPDSTIDEFYQQHLQKNQGFMNLDTLFGQVIASNQPVIRHFPDDDQHRQTMPSGHPPTHSFLGMPVHLGTELLGVIGLANCTEGEMAEVIHRLLPVMGTCAQLLDGINKERERERTAQALKKANSFMSALVENLQAGLLVENEYGEIYTVNQAYCDIFGRKDMPLMIEGSPSHAEFAIIQAMTAEPEQFFTQREKCLKAQSAVIGREITLHDSRILEQDYLPVIFEDENGNIHHNHLWAYRDISEHKRILDHVQQQGRQIEQIQRFVEQTLDALTSSICVLDETGCILYGNQVWKIMGRGKGLHDTGYNIGTSYLSLCRHTENDFDTRPIRKALRQLLRGESESFVIEYSYQESTQQRWVLLHATRFGTNDGLRIVVSHDDITELRQAIAAAEAATKAKSQFLATMSHEIRTPMNGVLGLLYLLGKTELNAKQRRFIETATGSGKMLLTVINDILDFSKLESDMLELERIPFELAKLIEETAALLAKAAHEKGLELICLIGFPPSQVVMGDPTRLRQILTNLVNNAIKFTEKGDIIISVNPVDDGIHFKIKDTGIGISDEEQQKLFKAFSQVDSSHTRKFGGTGLGLAISRKLVVAMGGDIHVESTPAQGSEFSFTLALEQLATDPLTAGASTLLSEQAIFLVSNHQTLRSTLKNILSQWKISRIGESAEDTDALAQLHAAARAGTHYSVILLDNDHPNRLELACAIRHDATLSTMNLIMLNTADQDTSAPEPDAWLIKPVRHSELYNCLLQSLNDIPCEPRISPPVSNIDAWWFGGHKLLLVEDNLVNQAVAQEILGAAGFDILICDNGAKAVQAVQETRYDIVLMDIQMPVMDGFEATREIRALGDDYARLPIIAMTAHALYEDKEKSLAAGMNGHVTKPVDPEALFTEISHWLTARERPAPALTIPGSDPAAPEIIIPPLPGIDSADGLQRLNGNAAVYQKILLGFHNKHADAADKLEAYIHDANWDEAARLAHTLKGSGGNLGAKHLAACASAVEQSCRNEGVTTDTFEALELALNEVLSGLIKLAANTADIKAEAISGTMTPAEWFALLDKLISSLDDDLSKAQSYLTTLRQHAADEFKAPLNALEGALDSFDIDTAKEIGLMLQAQHRIVDEQH